MGLIERFVNNKYGFANRQGKIVIKPAYDWAGSFEHGPAAVCNQCREVCAMPGGVMELNQPGFSFCKLWFSGRTTIALPRRGDPRVAQDGAKRNPGNTEEFSKPRK